MRCLSLAALWVLAACKPPDLESPCGDRTGGGLVEITVTDETFTFWTEDSVFLDRALELEGTTDTQVAMFEDLVDGTDCDAQWTFHVGPTMSWVDLATEVCDGRPSDVEGDKAYWLDTVGQWCPWGPLVTSVDDRR